MCVGYDFDVNATGDTFHLVLS